MARPGYTNLAPTDQRKMYFEMIARSLSGKLCEQELDPTAHRDRISIIDFALAYTAMDIDNLMKFLEGTNDLENCQTD